MGVKQVQESIVMLILILDMQKQASKNSKKSQKMNEKEEEVTFYRREYEAKLSDLQMPHHYFGYTNRILCQNTPSKKDLDEVNLFIPIYPILKIKSLQDIDVQKLTGSISCVLIINVLIEGLPQPLIHLLENSIEMQINRSEVLILKEDFENRISFKRTKRMLVFTIRKTLTASIMEDTLWEPFEVIRLIVSLTFNSISKKKGMKILQQFLKAEKLKQEENEECLFATVIRDAVGSPDKKDAMENTKVAIDSFNQMKFYTISFNCMRNGNEVPISYSLNCVYSLYDLAEKKLEVYNSNLDSISEVKNKFEEKQTKKDDNQAAPPEKPTIDTNFPEADGQEIKVSNKLSLKEMNKMTKEVFVEMQTKTEKKQDKVKVKYFQYTHFVIPLYKYPGNSLATIFIPILLLSLLSLAIFFQNNDLSDRLGSIATMVLGYIALIPSIKEQLPPSSKITIIEWVIYVSTLCCLFSLVDSFIIDEDVDYVFKWYSNPLFLICLFIHLSVFVFILTLLALHKLKWQPGYNLDKEAKMADPENKPFEWINPYCDQVFYKANQKIYSRNLKANTEKDKASLIVKYEPIVKKDSELSAEKKPSMNLTDSLLMMGKEENTAEEVKSEKKVEEVKPEKMLKQEKSEEKPKQGGSKAKIEDNPKKKEKTVLAYEKHLEFLDKLIKSGGHTVWQKPKSASKALPKEKGEIKRPKQE